LIAEFDGEIPSLSVKRPTLEEIYLEMIGESNPDLLEEVSP
jgi:hypothetical protein